MGAAFCEPSAGGLLAYGLAYAILGVVAGWFAGRARRGVTAPGDGSGMPPFVSGCLLPALGSAIPSILLVRVVYQGCEAAAWGLAPGGAMLALVILPLAGFFSFHLASRGGRW